MFTFSALVTTNEGVCETFSFLYACLAPIVGLQVYGGCYPGHLFLYLALDGLVNETTADYNLRHSTTYLEKAAVDDEYQDPIPAYLLIRWRLIQTSLMHMTGNAGYWDPRLLMIGNRLFPKDPFFQGSSFQTQLALAHFSTGNQKQAFSICKKLGPQSIRYDVLLLILASHQQRGLTQQAKIIEDFIAHLKKN